MTSVSLRRAVPEPVEQSVLDDLRARLRATRPALLPDGLGWERGTDPAYLRELLISWAQDYDWRAVEERLRDQAWVHAAGLRMIRPQPGAGMPVLLLHGWPDSFYRFDRLLPLLEDVDPIVPCLPGYPYADPVTDASTSATTMADQLNAALGELGIGRCVVSGGDIGSSVAEQLAARHGERVAALHLTDVPWQHLFEVAPDQLTPAEQRYRDQGQQWQLSEGAYALEQATKPHTLAAGLADSPAGLAAWIVEKLHGWSACGGDVESVFPREELLTWITLYWVTATIGSSFLPYAGAAEPLPGPVTAPTVVTTFPGDLVNAPREFAERFFDVRGWDEQPDGGHFGAWERPEAYARAVRQAVALAGG